MCDLCRVAWENRNGVKIHNFPVIPDLQTWWYGTRDVETIGYELSGDVCLQNDMPNMHRKRRDTTRLLSDLFYE